MVRTAVLVMDFINAAFILGVGFLFWQMTKAQREFNDAVLKSIRDFETRLHRLEGGATDFIPGWKPDPDCRDCQEMQRTSKFPLATCPKHGPTMGLWVEKG
jgi:hypothetical protein